MWISSILFPVLVTSVEYDLIRMLSENLPLADDISNSEFALVRSVRLSTVPQGKGYVMTLRLLAQSLCTLI